MSKRFIDDYCCDINNITDVITKLTSSYRLMVGGAEELNRITLAKKSDVKSAIKRVNKIGDMIDDYLKVLEDINLPYFEYCKLRSDYYKSRIKANFILEEIEEELEKKSSLK